MNKDNLCVYAIVNLICFIPTIMYVILCVLFNTYFTPLLLVIIVVVINVLWVIFLKTPRRSDDNQINTTDIPIYIQ